MKVFYFLICSVVILSSCGKNTSSGGSGCHEKPYSLVWSDEFDVDALPDTTKWSYDIGGGGWGNNELQFYTNQPENAYVSKGNLVIETKKERYQSRNYTSARLLTKNKAAWAYGKFEIKAKLPKGVGTWPAIWLLSAHVL